MEEEDEDILFSFDIDDKYPFSELVNEELECKYRFLQNFEKMQETWQNYVLLMEEENIYYDANFMPYFAFRDVKTSDEEDLTFFEEYQYLTAGILNKKYTYTQVKESGMEILRKDKSAAWVLACESLEELYSTIKENAEQLHEENKYQKIRIEKKKYQLGTRITAGIFGVLVLLLIITSYQSLVVLPRNKAIIRASRAYTIENYVDCIDQLKDIKPEQMDTYAVCKMLEYEKSNLIEWMKNMETAYGDDAGDLDDTEKFEIYLPLYLERYQGLSEKYQDKGDFSHMMYTISANQIDKGKKVDNYFVIAEPTGLYWHNAEERKDIVGWLGDAVFEGDEEQVSFGNSDYIADLDADNIAYRMNRNGMSLPDTMLHYYSDLENVDGMDTNLSKEEIEHNNRTREFLIHNKYEDIETAIFERIKVEDGDKDGKLTYKDLDGVSKYEGTYKFLCKLKECMNEA